MINTRSHLLLHALATLVTVGATTTMAGGPPLSNGSFEDQPAGTFVSADSSDSKDDRTTFTGWRIFSIGNPPAAGFSATLVPEASDGKVAMQLRVDDTGAAEMDQAMDREGTEVSINPDTVYHISFDAAHISGDNQLILAVAEYDNNRSFLDSQTAVTFDVTDSKYQTFELDWKCKNPAAEKVGLAFRIKGVATFNIDNVCMKAVQPNE